MSKSDYELFQGHALTVLKTMPSETVQCAITSPPYYGLRSYKTEPQIWDSNRDHNHAWGDTLAFSKQDIRSAEVKRQQGAAVGGSITFNDVTTTGNSGSFCQLCNAWRGELGLEPRFQDYIRHLIQIFAEVKRVLKPDGVCFVNLGDSYAGSGKGIGDKNGHGKSVFTDDHISKTDWSQIDVRAKSLMNIPHRVFIAMTDELQLIQRNNINWWKRACMPSSATDRWTVDFESIGFFTKNAKYKFNQQLEAYTKPLDRWGGDKLVANGEGQWDKGTGQDTYRNRDMRPNPEGRNARTTWDVAYEPSGDEHYASYPTKLVERMILAGTDEDDTVLDIFAGTGSTMWSAYCLGRKPVGIELNPEYCKLIKKRMLGPKAIVVTDTETGKPIPLQHSLFTAPSAELTELD